jgi:phosphopantetheinyl transferase
MVACAVGDLDTIGIDVERHRPRSFAAMAEFGFGRNESARVTESGAPEFYRIWTLREAMGKATGEGLALALDGEDRVREASSEGLWRETIKGQEWLLGSFQPALNISLALAGLRKAGFDPASCVVRQVVLTANSLSRTWTLSS